MMLEAYHMSWFKGLIKILDYGDNNHYSHDPSHGYTMLGAMSRVQLTINLKWEVQGNAST